MRLRGSKREKRELPVVGPLAHPAWISDEDGETYWLRGDLAFDETPVIRLLCSYTGVTAEDFEAFHVTGKVLMRQATAEDVEEGRCTAEQVREGWYFTVQAGEPGDVEFWQVTV